MNVPNLSVAHRRQAEALARCTAMTFHHNGEWNELSWQQVRTQADRCAARLIRLGVGIGDRVALLAGNSVDWVIADLALLTVGAISVPLNPQTPVPTLVRQITHAGACGLIAQSPQMSRPLLTGLPADCSARFVTYFDSDDHETSEIAPDVAIHDWNFWCHDESIDLDVTLLREKEVQPDDAATIIYTSGTTSQPKGVVLSHSNFWHNATATATAGGYSTAGCTLSWLPFSHAFARTADLYVTMISGGTLGIVDHPDQVIEAARSVMPTWMTGVPRFFEKIWQQMEALPAEVRPGHLREIFGRRIHHLISGGGALPDRVAKGFAESGVPLYQGYGLTEASPVISFNTVSRQRTGSVGCPLPNVEVRIGADAEIRTRGPHIMQGYWRDASATRQVILNGWLHTGDLGRIDEDGFLYVTGRRKEVFKTSVGISVVPNQIEALLNADPLIDQVVVLGEKRPFVTALIVPNFDQLSASAPSADDDQICITCEHTLAQLADCVHARQAGLHPGQRVRRFAVLRETLTVETGLLTPTQKIRRAAVSTHYRSLLDRLYGVDSAQSDPAIGEVQSTAAARPSVDQTTN